MLYPERHRPASPSGGQQLQDALPGHQGDLRTGSLQEAQGQARTMLGLQRFLVLTAGNDFSGGHKQLRPRSPTCC